MNAIRAVGDVAATSEETRRMFRRGISRSYRTLAVAVAVLAAIIGLTALFYFLSIRILVPDSDSATVVLEGQSMATGHLTLDRWALSLDSFWSVDALFNTFAVLIVGVRAFVLYAVPALIGSLVVLVGVLVSATGYKRLSAIAAGITVFCILGLPDNYLVYFMMRSVSHVATTLWSLVAFLLLTRRSKGFGITWAGAVCFLAAGLLGDFQMVALGLVPVVLAALSTMLRRRSNKVGWRMISAAAASCCLALIVRLLAEAIGTFSIGAVQPHASVSQMVANLKSLPRAVFHLFGSESGTGGILRLPQAVHYVELTVVLTALLVYLIRLVIGLIRGGQEPPTQDLGRRRLPWQIEDLLLFGCAGSVVVYVVLSVDNDYGYQRYLTAAVIFSSLLAAKFVADTVTYLGKRKAVLVPVAAFVVIGVSLLGIGVGNALEGPVLTSSAAQLGVFLEDHQLHSGLGDYWSSSITTVITDDRVKVRPVIGSKQVKVVRYQRQSSRDWYSGKTFQFLVYSTTAPSGVNSFYATRTWGKPNHVYSVSTYIVMTWSHRISVPPNGRDPNKH